MIEAPIPDEGLVRRAVIAALSPTLGVAARTARSPSFARRVDGALAGADSAVPSPLVAAALAALASRGIAAPAQPPPSRRSVGARTLRLLSDGLDWAATRDDGAARQLMRASQMPADDAAAILATSGDGELTAALVDGSLVLSSAARIAASAFAASLERIASAYRVQGATAHEVAATILLEFSVPDANDVLAVAAALDRACALAGRTWEPDDLRAALDRELHGTCGEAVPAPESPGIVAAEPQRAIPGRRKHFSASSLNMYAECARKWYFRYQCAAVEDVGSSASAYGSAFHAALEAFHGAYPNPAGIPMQTLSRRLEADIDTAFERFRSRFESEVEYRLGRRRALRTARKYLAWLTERARKEPFEVAGCEVEANALLGGIEFVGYIDRIDRDLRTGAVTVVDYKTGAIATSAAEYRQKIKASRDFQLPYYYWAQTEAGERVRSLALIPLRDAMLEVDPVELEVVPVLGPPARGERDATRGVISIDELERAREAMIAISGRLASGTVAHFEATDDADACRFCVYAPSCREKPAPDEVRFAR